MLVGTTGSICNCIAVYLILADRTAVERIYGAYMGCSCTLRLSPPSLREEIPAIRSLNTICPLLPIGELRCYALPPPAFGFQFFRRLLRGLEGLQLRHCSGQLSLSDHAGNLGLA